MEIITTVDDFETLVAIFGGGEFFGDSLGYFTDEVGGGGADVDLLNLNGGFEGTGEFEVNKDGAVEIDTVVVNGVVDFVKNADDHEMLAVVSEGFGEGLGAAEELHGYAVTEDCDVFAETAIKELTVL